MKALRRIKPVGSVDDYEAGCDNGSMKQVDSEAYLASIMNSIKDKYLSAREVSVVTGRSRNSAHNRLKQQQALGTVVVENRRVPGTVRPVLFYKAAA